MSGTRAIDAIDPIDTGRAAAQGPALGARPDLQACRVAVLMGGRSSEREVSLSSGAEVLAALRGEVASGHMAAAFAVRIESDGTWVVEDEHGAESAAVDALSALSSLRSRTDICFLALHGGEGEDGSVQGLLGGAGLAFTGSGVGASALCMDKQATRALARAAGVRVARGACVGVRDGAADADALAVAIPSASGWFVKPRHGGSSVDTACIPPGEPGRLAAAIDAARRGGDDAVVEERIEGVEVSCGVLGNRGEAPRALPPVEIRPHAGRFFDYEEKYSAGGAVELCPCEGVTPDALERVQRAAELLHALCGCDGYSRVDFLVTPGASGPGSGEPVLLELNTLPGLTPRSLLPREARAAGAEYPELCLWIVGAALRRASTPARSEATA